MLFRKFSLLLFLCSSCALWAQTGPGTFEFSQKNFNAVEGGNPNNVLRVLREDGTSGEVSVNLVVTGGNAVAGEDFKILDQVLSFADGEKEKLVKLEILPDGMELPETIQVELRDPTAGANLGLINATRIRIVMIAKDVHVLGLLFAVLALVFASTGSSRPFWQKFYAYFPSLLLCYFMPSVLATLGVISGDHSQLYTVASRYLLPACLVLLCLSIDLQGLRKLGPKALIMFLTGTVGVVIGGPLALLIVGTVSPETVGGEGSNAVWRGLTTIAGAWIGGGANQAAMKEVFQVGDQIFSATVTVDIIMGNLWMAVLLFMAGKSDQIDKSIGADNTAIKELQTKLEQYQDSIARIPSLGDMMKYVGVSLVITSIGQACGDVIAPWITKNYPSLAKLSLDSSFFWLVVVATLGGLALSFTPARKWEGVGASKMGSAFLYVLVATIGMKMDLMSIFERPGLFVVGAIWISIHGGLLLLMARLIKAPVFFLAVGSQANIGGAASAPIVASAFHPTLAPVGVMLAVLGYFVGTFGGWLCGLIMQAIAA